MFEYVKDNYPLNLSLSMALDMGACMDEVDRASREAARIAAQGQDPNDAFFAGWVAEGGRLESAARADEAQGHGHTAAEKYRRASIMFLTAERMASHTDPARLEVYERVLDTFSNYARLSGVACEKLRVPYEGASLPALFCNAAPAGGKAPCMVHFNGLDGIKEFLFLCGFPEALRRRGVSILLVDNPGVGEALRKGGLYNGPDAEKPAGACADYLAGRPEVDADRLGMIALSLGGYHAPRAAAFEPRFKLCVAWGANYDWGVRLRRRIAGAAGEKSVPQYFEHIQWVLGQDNIEGAARIADACTLNGIMERIRVPLLVVHGEQDRQIPVEEARRTVEEAVNSPDRELKIFSAEEGGEQHCSIGNMRLCTDFMADWIADRLVGPAPQA